MAKTLDDMKMVHEEEMQNYDRIQEAVTRVMHYAPTRMQNHSDSGL